MLFYLFKYFWNPLKFQIDQPWLVNHNPNFNLINILVLFPFYILTGSLINKYLECSTELDDHAIHLLFSANRWELLYVFLSFLGWIFSMHLSLNISTHRPDMKKLLQKGTNVIVDRYSYSGIAFSAAKPVYLSRIFS